jgi:hypothetical protein
VQKLRRYLPPLLLALPFAGVLIYVLCAHGAESAAIPGQCSPVGRLPRICPDFSQTVIPPNIAPLNFLVQESGTHYFVRIYSKQGRTIEVFSRSAKIVIPQRPWHELIDLNRGEELHFDVFVKPPGAKPPAKIQNAQWNRFLTVTSKIAAEDIDDYLVYRRIHPACGAWAEMGIYQRNLHNFEESLVLNNGYFGDGCLNCHTFCANQPDKMLIAVRSAEYGSPELLVKDGVINKVGTKFGYTSWHPSGRVVAYSINEVNQFFHSARDEIRDVIDLDSLVAYYLVDSKTAKTSPNISKKDRLETYPAWSADGHYLYFCSAPLLWSQRNVIPARYNEIKYDLLRISYDLDRDQWGELETILSAEDTGLSILLPRISPDGRWLLFCMCEYGCFPVYQQSSDLYMMDLEAPAPVSRQEDAAGRFEYKRLDINSDQSESWHSWSSNSRWIAFSSKRQSGVFTRIYLAYVDEAGRVCKPLLLPQKDPTYYDSCLWTYSVPELIAQPVRITKEKLARVLRGSQKVAVEMPITMATPKAVTLPAHDEPWQQGRQ